MTTGSQGHRTARGFTLLLTYVTKVVGLASAFNQLLLQSNPRALPLAVAAFMMAGAQLSEGVVLAVLDRMFPGVPEQQAAVRGDVHQHPESEGA